LDALCKRYGIDNSARTKHGALLDAELLAEVYLQLVGGHQPMFDLSDQSRTTVRSRAARTKAQPRPQLLPPMIGQSEIEAHQAFVGTLKEPLWLQYQDMKLDDETRA
jgi:DNA polymerase-3 subunit epsilon